MFEGSYGGLYIDNLNLWWYIILHRVNLFINPVDDTGFSHKTCNCEITCLTLMHLAYVFLFAHLYKNKYLIQAPKFLFPKITIVKFVSTVHIAAEGKESSINCENLITHQNISTKRIAGPNNRTANLAYYALSKPYYHSTRFNVYS